MNPVLHFEIPADNVERATTFYRDAFQWGMTAMPEMKYTIVETTEIDAATKQPKNTGAINGGMFMRSKDLVAPIITIGVEDIDSAMKAVQEKGGTVVGEKVSLGDMGFAAYFRDTEGNVMGLWSKK